MLERFYAHALLTFGLIFMRVTAGSAAVNVGLRFHNDLFDTRPPHERGIAFLVERQSILIAEQFWRQGALNGLEHGYKEGYTTGYEDQFFDVDRATRLRQDAAQNSYVAGIIESTKKTGAIAKGTVLKTIKENEKYEEDAISQHDKRGRMRASLAKITAQEIYKEVDSDMEDLLSIATDPENLINLISDGVGVYPFQGLTKENYEISKENLSDCNSAPGNPVTTEKYKNLVQQVENKAIPLEDVRKMNEAFGENSQPRKKNQKESSVSFNVETSFPICHLPGIQKVKLINTFLTSINPEIMLSCSKNLDTDSFFKINQGWNTKLGVTFESKLLNKFLLSNGLEVIPKFGWSTSKAYSGLDFYFFK